jgi:hypothetical protein
MGPSEYRLGLPINKELPVELLHTQTMEKKKKQQDRHDDLFAGRGLPLNLYEWYASAFSLHALSAGFAYIYLHGSENKSQIRSRLLGTPTSDNACFSHKRIETGAGEV